MQFVEQQRLGGKWSTFCVYIYKSEESSELRPLVVFLVALRLLLQGVLRMKEDGVKTL